MTNPNPLGFESPKIPQGGPLGANWKNGELHDAFQSLTVDKTYEQARQYEAAVNLWEEGVETFARSIHRSISDAWEGVSAEAAKQAISDYTTAAQQLTKPLQDLTNHMVNSAAAVVATKNAIPPGVHIDATSWLWPPHRFDLEDEQGRNRQQGWESYKSLYVEPLGKVDSSVPVLPKASDQNHSIDIVPGKDTGDSPPSGSLGPEGPAGTTGPGESGDEDRAKPNDRADDPSQPDQAAGQDNSPGKSTAPAGVEPNSVRPSGFEAPALATTPSGLSTGGSGFPGGSHTGSPAGVSGPGVAGPGRSIPGTGVVPQNPAAAARFGAGTSTSGLPGMPGMGMPGRGAKNDDEAVHKTPEYLENAENTEELLGPDPKTIPGGVIGGDFDARDRPDKQ